MYKIYDTNEKSWVKDNVYLAPNGDIYIAKKTLFGTEKLSLVSSQRYISLNNIRIFDKNSKPIFEGDICKIEAVNAIGVVGYTEEHASYYLFDYNNSKYYSLGFDKGKEIEIIGNMLDNPDLMPSFNELNQKYSEG